MNDYQALQLITNQLQTVLAAISDEDWARSTPCTEWNVGEVVDHVTGGNWFTLELFSGKTADEAMEATKSQFSQSYDRSTAATSSLEDQLDFFSDRDLTGIVVHHIGEDISGVAALRTRIHELVIHTWDIESGLGSPATIGPELVRWCLAELGQPDSRMARLFDVSGNDLVGLDTPQKVLLSGFGR